MIHPSARVHETAIVEQGVSLGSRTSVWDNAHVRFDARLGDDCIVGGKTYIAYEVIIGHRVKLNASVYICNGVTIEDGVMIGAATVFTNDLFPRAATNDLSELRPSEPDEHTLATRVASGASIGAHCTIGCDLVIGRYAMVGMGSVVTRSVPDHALVFGNPARFAGWVCRCGQPVLRTDNQNDVEDQALQCTTCGDHYQLRQGELCLEPTS